MQSERERRHHWVTSRISVLEDAMQVILARLGAEPDRLKAWRGHTLSPGDPSMLHSTMNDILNRLKPPPK